jgi:serine/threonine protein kinase/Tfp pilus assembly protein PilF
MGIIYVCYDHESKASEVKALKTIQDKYLQYPGAVNRFKREAETWVRLGKHPNIVQASIVLEIDRQPYIFLEYVPGYKQYGADLTGWVYSGRLQISEKPNIPLILNFAIQFCHGMTHAQKKFEEMGKLFVHRDIKPSNILVTENGIVKVTDFGLAKTLVEAGQDIPVTMHSVGPYSKISISRSGEVVGTLPYMSPEQCRGEQDLDHRSDIYSFGCVLYEMATRRFVFNVKTPQDFIYHHIKTMPKPTNAHRELDRVIMKCLEKKLKHRYQNFEELARHLSEIYYHSTEKAVKPPNEMSLDNVELCHKGISLAVLGFPQEASVCFQQVLGTAPKVGFVHGFLGRTYIAQGKLDAATIEFEEALKDDPMDATAHFELGNIHYKRKEFDKAITEFKIALSISPNDAGTHVNLGLVYFDQEKLDMAEAQYKEALKIDKNMVEAHTDLAYVYLLQNKLNDAVAEYKQALQISPNDGALHNSLGFAYHVQGNHSDSIAAYRKSLSIDPNNATTHLNLARVYDETGRLDETVVECKAALKIDPSAFLAYFFLGNVCRMRQKFSDAIEFYERFIKSAGAAYDWEVGRATRALMELRQERQL